MEKLKPRTLSGFMELLPAPQQKFERLLEILRRTFALYGFTPIDTPVIESADILLAKGGGETEKQIYRFQKGDSDLALRFDHTVPLAKYVALHENELCFPFRRYAIGKVYRGERAQRGRFREFYQADIDIIGDGKLSVVNEAEIPSVIYKVFSEFGLKRFCISVNNRKILNGFYAMLGLTAQSGDIMRTVDKLDKIGAEKVRTILIEDIGLSASDADEILRFIAIRGTNAEVLAALEGYRGRNEAFDTGLSIAECIGIANKTLYADLHFSRHDTISSVLWNEFSAEVQLEAVRENAIRLCPLLEEVFAKYPISDEFVYMPEYNSLYTEITGFVQLKLEEDGKL